MTGIQNFSDQELLKLLRDIESDRVERKRNFSDGDKARQAVCAFANDLPEHNKAGILFIGAEDDGKPSNITVTDEFTACGNIYEMLRSMEERLMAHNRKAYDVSRGPHVISWDYPHSAIQQILYNAVLHRTYEGTNAPARVYWYNDRIEFFNTGGPYGDITVENFGKTKRTDYRNPNIADVMKTLGFVQKFGRGIDIARSEMRKNGNPPPEFEVEYGAVTCILWGKK